MLVWGLLACWCSGRGRSVRSRSFGSPLGLHGLLRNARLTRDIAAMLPSEHVWQPLAPQPDPGAFDQEQQASRHRFFFQTFFLVQCSCGCLLLVYVTDTLSLRAESKSRPNELVPTGKGSSAFLLAPSLQGGQVLKPPRSSSITTGDACIGCPAAAGGAQRKPSIQSSQEASEAAVFQHHHAGGEANPDNIPAGDGPVPLAPFGTSAMSIRSSSAAAGVPMHKRGGGGMELEPEAVVVGDLATPLASAGAGDVGAEHDATPLQSRHKSSARSGGFASPSSGGGGEARGETASEGAASVSGVDDSLSSVGEGPGGLKRMDTLTWESFLADMTVSDEAKEGGGAKGAEAAAGSCSDSPPTVAMRLPPEAASEGVKVGCGLGFLFFFLPFFES